MKRVLIFATFLLFAASLSVGQAIVRGKVIDDKGETVPLAPVKIKEEPEKRAVTDLDGNFEINITADVPRTLVVRYVGFATREISVQGGDGEVIVQNIDLYPKTQELKEVVISVRTNKGSDAYMEKQRQNRAVQIDYIPAEVMKKVGDATVDDAIKRISGVSTFGGYVSVRGLADRYIATTLNGSRVPTLDPLTNNIKLDVFPAALVDNVVITKTFSPELPGDWSGAYISMETIDYPDKLRVDISSSFGYNDQFSFQEILRPQSGSSDWLGLDDGFREIPEESFDIPSYVTAPTFYEQFEVLDIGDELRSQGINENSSNELVKVLGLVELGYLSAGLIDDEQAVNAATEAYQTDYPSTFFLDELNSGNVAASEGFNNTFVPDRRTAPMLFSQNISIGNQTKLFKRSLGYFLGFRYNTRTEYDPNAEITRLSRGVRKDESEDFALIGNADLTHLQISTGWAAVATLAYKFSNKHRARFMLMPVFSGQDNLRYQANLRNESIPDSEQPGIGIDQLYNELRRVLYQWRSQHFFPSKNIKVNVDASYTDGLRKDLDFRRVTAGLAGTEDLVVFDSNLDPERSWREMSEKLIDSRISAEMPIATDSGSTYKRTLKVGGSYYRNVRENDQTQFVLNNLPPETGVTVDSLGEFLENVEYTTSKNTPFYQGGGNVSLTIGSELDNDLGFTEVTGAFAMTDFEINPKMRLAGGLRMEHTNIFIDIRSFYTNEVAPNDPQRDVQNGFASPGIINQTDFLPSLNAIYKLKETDDNLVNLRVGYGRSLARPSLREISPLQLVDFSIGGPVQGNPDLQMSNIDNFDVRIEDYFKTGNISLSLYYKKLKNHIQLVSGAAGLSWENAQDTRAIGLEIEGRKEFLLDRTFESKFLEKFIKPTINKLEVRGNVSLIGSETRVVQDNGFELTHPMFGQAPYLLNGIVTYTGDSSGVSVGVSYNVQGPKIIFLQTLDESSADLPNIYEVPRHFVDLKVSKKFGQHFTVSFRIRNLLNQPYRRAYRFDSGFLVDFDRYTYGAYYNLGLAYSL